MSESGRIQLTHRDWLRLQEMSVRIHEAESTFELGRLVAEELAPCVGADWAGWNEHDSRIKLLEAHVPASHQFVVDDFLPTLNGLMESHPILEGMGLLKKLKLHREVSSLTDFKTVRQLNNVPIWHDAYRHLEARHQMLAQFCTDGVHGVLLTVNAVKPFTMRQRLMVGVLRDHFEVACRRLVLEPPLRASDGSRPALTRRESEVLPHLLRGKTNPELAVILGISPRTVEKHVARLLEKFGVESRASLIALRRGCW